MRAAVWTRYGPPEVMQVMDIEKPVPRDDEILIRVQAASLSKADCEMRNLSFPWYIGVPMRLVAGLGKPKRIKVLGQEAAGVVEAVGSKVVGIKPGDTVMASTGFKQGAHAEYLCVSINDEDCLVAGKPENIDFQGSACIATSAIEAYCFMKQANLRKGSTVMIVGAGGGFGTFAVQLAKNLGADVTAVDSGSKLPMLESLGADSVVDFKETDYARLDRKFDAIFDIVCIEKLSRMKNLLNVNGVYLAGNPRIAHFLQASGKRKRRTYTVIPHSGKHTNDDLKTLKTMLENGELKVVIDSVYTLDKIRGAFMRAESGEKKGNIILDCT